MKLKTKDIREYRQTQLQAQDNLCALCQEPVETDAVLDHDHRSGFLRKVLHRGCNAMLGKIENNMARNRMDMNRLEIWANNLVGYINQTHTDVIHPTHLTPEERKMKKKKGRGKGRGR
jgi:hypothetical protein